MPESLLKDKVSLRAFSNDRINGYFTIFVECTTLPKDRLLLKYYRESWGYSTYLACTSPGFGL